MEGNSSSLLRLLARRSDVATLRVSENADGHKFESITLTERQHFLSPCFVGAAGPRTALFSLQPQPAIALEKLLASRLRAGKHADWVAESCVHPEKVKSTSKATF